jgi:hypothetical protein
MKTKLTFLITLILISLVTLTGCTKRPLCCVLPEVTNAMVAKKKMVVWRAPSKFYFFNKKSDTIIVAGNINSEQLNIQLKKNGTTYTFMDATYDVLTGDIVNADYVLDTTQPNTYSTISNTTADFEGIFTLYLKLNHSDNLHIYPPTLVFKNGQFMAFWQQ